MENLSFEVAKEIANEKIYELLKLGKNHKNAPIIVDDYTLDFEWGILFYYNGKKGINK